MAFHALNESNQSLGQIEPAGTDANQGDTLGASVPHDDLVGNAPEHTGDGRLISGNAAINELAIGLSSPTGRHAGNYPTFHAGVKDAGRSAEK